MVLACLLAAAYATLPWWAPEDFLQRRFADSLSRQLGLPVSIERLDMSWGKGIVLTGLRIGDRAEFGGGDMVSVGALRCDLSPIHLAATGRLRWVEIDDARLRAVVDSNGQVNLASLQGLSAEDSSPPEWLRVRRAVVTLQFPRQDRLLRLNVYDLQYRAGRLESLGKVTMSAALAQEGPDAPVSLKASAGGAKDPTAASCSFDFAGVDIRQLQFPRLLGLPLEQLAGEASGRLNTRLNRSGAVDRFSLAITVKNLDAQPASGPRLPVFKEAKITLSASYDPLASPLESEGGRLEIKDITLQLPGIRLEQGSASMSGRGWGGVRRLELKGVVDPTILSALTGGGGSSLPGGVQIDGDVKFNVQMEGDERDLKLHLAADASAATVRIDGRAAKPAGRALAGEISAGLSKQTWDFTTDSAKLCLGDNYFTGAGAMQKVRAVARQWLEAGQSATVAMLLDGLGGLDWNGSWQISESDSLRELAGPAWPEGLRLKGRVEGQWSVRHGSAVIFNGSLAAPAGAALSLGEWFVKPRDQALRGRLAAEVDTRTPRLKNVEAWLVTGETTAALEDVSVSVALSDRAGGEPELIVRTDGAFHVDDADGLLRCVPAAAAWAGRVSGELSGRFSLMRSDSFRRVHLRTDATGLALDAGETFRKTAGQVAELVLDYAAGCDEEADSRLAVSGRLGAESFNGVAILPAFGEAEKPIRCEGSVRLTDAAALLGLLPQLKRGLKNYDVSGAATLRLCGRVGTNQMEGEASLDADELSFRLPATGGQKPRGAPLRLRLAGKLTPDMLALKLLAIDLGKSSISAEGQVRLRADAGAGEAGAFRRWPPPHVESADLKVRGRLGVDPAGQSLLPELARRLEGLGVSGAVAFQTDVRGREDGIELEGAFDAADMAIERQDVHKDLGRRADGNFDVFIPADLAQAHVRDLFLDGGDFQVRADTKWPLLADGRPEAHVALNVTDFERLGRRTPALAPYALAGGLLLEAELGLRDGAPTASYITLTARDLTARLGGKDCRMDGRATIENFSWGHAGKVAIGRVVADGLEFTAGESHGFIVADLADPLTAPKGRVELLCSKLDIFDLSQWESPSSGRMRSATVPAPLPPSRTLSQQELAALTVQGRSVVAAMRKAILPAEASLRLQADRLKYYDGEVKAMYEIRGVVADFDLHGGVLKADYRCGLSGGEMFQNYLADFRPEDVRLGVRGGTREVLSSGAIIAQLAKEFPGNTFYGTFSRSHDLSYSLRDVVMNMIDSRYYPPATGVSITITEDGLVRGRAAPRFISNIFPGLNLATYRYHRMTGFTKYESDGRMSSDLIFDGYNYDMYVEGRTNADRRGSFEIGVILVGSPQSAEFNHRYRPGRVPVLNFRARIDEGQFKDEEVWYKLPTETAYVIFFKNNLLYRIWLTSVSQGGAKAITSDPTAAPTK